MHFKTKREQVSVWTRFPTRSEAECYNTQSVKVHNNSTDFIIEAVTQKTFKSDVKIIKNAPNVLKSKKSNPNPIKNAKLYVLHF